MKVSWENQYGTVREIQFYAEVACADFSAARRRYELSGVGYHSS